MRTIGISSGEPSIGSVQCRRRLRSRRPRQAGGVAAPLGRHRAVVAADRMATVVDHDSNWGILMIVDIKQKART